MVSHWSNKDNNTSLPHRGVVGVLVLYRALRMQSIMCQVLLFCSHPNQCCADCHYIELFKSQIPVTDLTTPNIDHTSHNLPQINYKREYRFCQCSKGGPSVYLVYLCNIFIFSMIGFTESLKLIQDTSIVFCKNVLYHCPLLVVTSSIQLACSHFLITLQWGKRM